MKAYKSKETVVNITNIFYIQNVMTFFEPMENWKAFTEQPIRLSDRVFAQASRLLSEGRVTEAAKHLERYADKTLDMSFEVNEKFEALAAEAVDKIHDIFGEVAFEEYLRKLRRRKISLQLQGRLSYSPVSALHPKGSKLSATLPYNAPEPKLS